MLGDSCLSSHYSTFFVTTPEKPLRLELENLDDCTYKLLLGNAIEYCACTASIVPK